MFDAVRLIQVPIRGMGQAQIQAGQGFGGAPWSVETPLHPNVPPAGYTGEIIAPYGAETELGCYSCPDTGRFELLTRPQAEARGCSFAPPGSCPGAATMAPAGALAPGSMSSYAKGPPPGLMGRRMGAGPSGGGGGGAQGAPQGGGVGAQGSPQPASPAGASFSQDNFDPFFFPTLPLTTPGLYPPVPPAGTTCSWEKDTSGNSVYVCRQANGVVVPTSPMVGYGPVAYPVRTLFGWF